MTCVGCSACAFCRSSPSGSSSVSSGGRSDPFGFCSFLNGDDGSPAGTDSGSLTPRSLHGMTDFGLDRDSDAGGDAGGDVGGDNGDNAAGAAGHGSFAPLPPSAVLEDAERMSPGAVAVLDDPELVAMLAESDAWLE